MLINSIPYIEAWKSFVYGLVEFNIAEKQQIGNYFREIRNCMESYTSSWIIIETMKVKRKLQIFLFFYWMLNAHTMG